MRSTTVLDQHTPVAGGPDVRDLLVLWQHPDTRELVPIGRFTYDGHTYTYDYTRAAATVADLRPLPGLDDLNHHYVSERIPAVFAQRVMQEDRPDFAEYVDTLGLDRVTATPWEQIVQSGGMRAGDTLQFMQVPRVIDGRALARVPRKWGVPCMRGRKTLLRPNDVPDARRARGSPFDTYRWGTSSWSRPRTTTPKIHQPPS
jgi:hypothetical protein